MAIEVTSPVTSIISSADELGDGSVGSPSVSFLSDQTTGVYKSAGKTVGVACDGALSVEISDVAVNVHNLPLTNVGNITCKSTGQAITNLNAVTGIAAGADITNAKSLAGISAGFAITNATSVASTAADMTLVVNAHTIAKLTDTIADGKTGLLVRCNDAGVYTLQPVTLGAADSGGTGFRALIVPNAV